MNKMTNKHNLPNSIVTAITKDDYDYSTDEKTISATTLIQPTRVALLNKRHRGEVVEDVADNIWRLFGTSIHYILAKQDVEENDICEKRLSTSIDEWTLTGKPDMYKAKTKTLRDFKVTSVWKYIYGPKEGFKEWTEQLNIYAYLLRKSGVEVEFCTITAILRDWAQREAFKSPDYPQIAIKDIPIEVWDIAKQEAFICQKINSLREYNDKADEELPLCTEKERWATETTYAVMKEGRKTALRVLGTEKEAEKWANNNGHTKVTIDVRKGVDKRCDAYCSVNKWCKYHQEKQNGKS
jgi:hypothetical protein